MITDDDKQLMDDLQALRGSIHVIIIFMRKELKLACSAQ